MAKSIDLGSGLLCFIGAWIILCTGAYITFAAFSATQFEYPRSAHEAQQIFGVEYACTNITATPDSCVAVDDTCAVAEAKSSVCSALCDNNAYSWNWFLMQSHHLHIALYALFAAFFMWTFAVDFSTVASIVIGILGAAIISFSLLAYFFIVLGYCGMSDFCGYSQCPYSFKELGVSSDDLPAGNSTAYQIFLIVVPILNALSVLTSLVSCFAYIKIGRNKKNIEEDLEEDENLSEFSKSLTADSSSAFNGARQRPKKRMPRLSSDEEFMQSLVGATPTKRKK